MLSSRPMEMNPMKRLKRYLVTLPVILAAVLLAQLMQPHFNDTNVVMVYMLAVVVVAFRLGGGPAALACLLSIFLYDFVNVPPYFQVGGSELYQYPFTLLVMLITVGSITILAGSLKQRAAESAALYALSADLADRQTETEILDCMRRHLAQAFQAEVNVFPTGDDGRVACETGPLPPARGGAHRALPLQVEGKPCYRLVLRKAGAPWPDGRDRRDHLMAMTDQCAQALERIRLRERVHEKEIVIQKESLRNSILNTLSHDLRTPLASILGASSSLQVKGGGLSVESAGRLQAIIHAEALHMRHMVDNLLDMARLQGGHVQLTCAWEALEEIVGSAVATLRRRVKDHELTVDMPHDLPLIRCDSMLTERVLINLLENAVKYSPPGTQVRLTASLDDRHLLVTVANRGEGIAEPLREKVFEPFYRIHANAMSGGGLGLTICRSIITAHGGEIWITDGQDDDEILVQFTLPLATELPKLPHEAVLREAAN